jgi:hypothetical protein
VLAWTRNYNVAQATKWNRRLGAYRRVFGCMHCQGVLLSGGLVAYGLVPSRARGGRTRQARLAARPCHPWCRPCCRRHGGQQRATEFGAVPWTYRSPIRTKIENRESPHSLHSRPPVWCRYVVDNEHVRKLNSFLEKDEGMLSFMTGAKDCYSSSKDQHVRNMIFVFFFAAVCAHPEG